MDYTAYGRAYFAVTGVYITVLHKGVPTYSALAEQLGIRPQKTWALGAIDHSPSFCSLDDISLYGLVQAQDADWVFVVGPVYNIRLTDDVLEQTMQTLAIPEEYRLKLYESLCQSPITPPLQLAKHLGLLHFCLTGKEIQDAAIYQLDKALAFERTEWKPRIEHLKDGELHNSYYYEVAMYQKVREGNVDMLHRFFLDNKHQKLNEGLMALSPLRHAKNVFITCVSRAGFIGAIPGGLDTEKAYQLMDHYIRKCEQLDNVESVANLQYTMIVDFCRRTGEHRRPDDISSDVWHCMNYIRSHVYESITIYDVACSLQKSVSYVTKHFKKDIGMPVGAFIMRSKLEEAKFLLVFSNKTLAEISFDLCFSSQSYFQYLFKKEYGVTPARYRRKERTI